VSKWCARSLTWASEYVLSICLSGRSVKIRDRGCEQKACEWCKRLAGGSEKKAEQKIFSAPY
jgi:hypothetical protein